MSYFRGIGGLENGLEAAWMRNSVILNNVANVDTPDFKESRVEFETLYRSAIDGSDEDVDRNVRAVVVENETTTYRMDGNNVDIDEQMADLAKNVIYYNTLSTKISNEFSQLRLAIQQSD